MKLLRTLALAVVVAGWSLSAHAALLDFTFSFSNRAIGNVGGSVTGIVRGLSDNATTAATSVEVLSNSDGFGLGEYIGSPNNNFWVVESGAITFAVFSARGSNNSAPAVTCCSLIFSSSSSNGAALFNSDVGGGLDQNSAGLTFTRVATAVPEPASAFLFGGALAAAALLRRRRHPAV